MKKVCKQWLNQVGKMEKEQRKFIISCQQMIGHVIEVYMTKFRLDLRKITDIGLDKNGYQVNSVLISGQNR